MKMRVIVIKVGVGHHINTICCWRIKGQSRQWSQIQAIEANDGTWKHQKVILFCKCLGFKSEYRITPLY